MILSRFTLLAEINRGNICISPFDKQYVGEASVDLRLGNRLCPVTKESQLVLLERVEKVNPEEWFGAFDFRQYPLKSGELALGLTFEYIALGGDVCARFDGRSRFARLGLEVHATSSFVRPRSMGYQVLELFNRGPHILLLTPGVPICQIIFERCE